VLGVAIAAVAGGVAVVVCARTRYRQRRLAPKKDVDALERVFRSGDDAQMRAALFEAFPEAADVMLHAVGADSDSARRAAAAALDESLGDLDRDLSAHEGVSAAAIRVALLSAGFGAIVELSRDLSRLPEALYAGMLGVGVAAVCFELGRNTSRRATELRAAWDRVAGSAADRLGLAVQPASSPSRGLRTIDRDQRRRGRRGS